MKLAMDPATFRRLYSNLGETNPLWKKISAPAGQVYSWPKSSYIAEPPFFRDFSMAPDIPEHHGREDPRIFGDSVTPTNLPGRLDQAHLPAGIYLQARRRGRRLQHYGARRGNHEVMMRGTFANVRIKNLMLPGTEGGLTLYKGEKLPIYDAAMRYIADGTPTVVFGGEEYGTDVARLAAKGTSSSASRRDRAQLRAHPRSNLVGMGVLPLQFTGADSAQSLGLKGDETIDVVLPAELVPQQDLALAIRRSDGSESRITVRSRIDTAIEVDYYKHGGILPFVLRELMSTERPAKAKAA